MSNFVRADMSSNDGWPLNYIPKETLGIWMGQYGMGFDVGLHVVQPRYFALRSP